MFDRIDKRHRDKMGINVTSEVEDDIFEYESFLKSEKNNFTKEIELIRDMQVLNNLMFYFLISDFFS